MPTFGRRMILTDYTYVDENNVLKVLNDTLPIHLLNADEIWHLREVYKGNQAILHRKKDIRPEINEKVCINIANQIVSFKVSYLLSEPIMYVTRGSRDDVSDDIDFLNACAYIDNKAAQDKELADEFNICGVAYRVVLPSETFISMERTPDDAPFHTFVVRPEFCYLIRSTEIGNPVVAGVTIKRQIDNSDPIYTVYTPWSVFTIQSNTIRSVRGHALGAVPIIEYINNNYRIGSFEICESVLDALNTLSSDRLNSTMGTVQALMIFKNCDISADEFEALRASGAIKLVSNGQTDSDVKLLTADLNQSDQQIQFDSLYKSILSITGMPAQSSENKSDSSNNGAVFMRSGWFNADARAKDSESLWRKSESELLRIELNICRTVVPNFDLRLCDIDLKFTRRNYEDIQAKAQAMRTMLESGVSPEIAIAQSGLFGDPTAVWEASREYMEKWKLEPEQIEPMSEGDSDGDAAEVV